ncbi:MAG: hypothetical protein GVX78_03055 [Bacteroidetes bacterium]|nr:hypothetical protein [Bacteroidota bacterium]
MARRRSILFLSGFMGVGKSFYGKKVADQLGIPFFDLDQEIIARAHMSVKDIFELKGEGYFRKLERDLLLFILENYSPPFVVSLGGGTLLDANLAAWLKSQGLLICLQRRTLELNASQMNQRPLSNNFDLYALYKKRVCGYSSAHACLRLDLFSEDQRLDRLIKLWKIQVKGV